MLNPHEGAMFEQSLRRPSNYFTLSSYEQWRIDSNIGILDWFGGCFHMANMHNCEECYERFNSHFNLH